MLSQLLALTTESVKKLKRLAVATQLSLHKISRDNSPRDEGAPNSYESPSFGIQEPVSKSL